jgi:hypothetical protein
LLGQVEIHGGDLNTLRSSAAITVPSDGIIIVRISQTEFFGAREHWYSGLTWTQTAGPLPTVAEASFSNLGYCEGSGLAEPDDGEEPPDIDPPPPGGPWPPPPVTADRPFVIHNVPVTGYAVWNGTMIAITPGRAVNVFNQAAGAGSYLFVRFGPESRWRDGSGQFRFELWEEVVEEFYNNNAANNALLAAIASGVAFCHYLIDEPFHLTRYGNPIPFIDVEKMAVKSKTLWPTWATNIRVDPTDQRYVRKMVGLDWMHAEYSLSRGPIDDYRRTRYTAAEEWGHGLVVGLHYKEFQGPAGPTPRYITPAEVASYGTALVTPWPGTTPSVACSGWRYESGLFVPGFSDAITDLRDYYGS